MNHRLAHVISGLLVLLTLNACGGAKPVPRSAAPQGVFVRGADISHLQKSEDNGAVYRDAQGEADPLVLLRRHGVTWARLRLWVRPEEPYSNLASVAAMAVRLRDAGMPWLLDIHYSDTWADPGNQFKPGFWSDMSYFPLEKQVRSYTADVIRTLREQGTPPDLVQPGNEIMQGFLWPEGRVGGSFDTGQQWAQFSDLLKAAIKGVRDGAGDEVIPIVIHVDAGGNRRACRWFFDNLRDRGVSFDVIGVSYYPWWHGGLEGLRTNLADLATRYRRDVLVVETGYPWTLQGFDDEHNLVGEVPQLHDGFPATPRGQADFLRALTEVVRGVPEGRGKGIFYWEPLWTTAPGWGSAWENVALFDSAGVALPGLDALGGR